MSVLPCFLQVGEARFDCRQYLRQRIGELRLAGGLSGFCGLAVFFDDRPTPSLLPEDSPNCDSLTTPVSSLPM